MARERVRERGEKKEIVTTRFINMFCKAYPMDGAS
jgi:hypothetical protein